MTDVEKNIFMKYDNQLYDYIKLAYPGYRQLLDEEREPYIKQLDALSDLYWFYNYLLDYNQDLFKNESHKPLALFYTKAASDIISVRQCLMVGQLLSATSIERNIFETFVDLSLILKEDTEERLNLYEDYQKVMLWTRFNEYEKYIKELESNIEIKKEIYEQEKEKFNEHYTSVVAKTIADEYLLVKENYHPSKPYHWAWKIFKAERNGHNPSIEFICKAVNLYDDYLHIYSANSIAVHNRPLMINFLRRGHGVTSTPSFSDKTKSIAGITMSFGIEIITQILEYVKFNKYDEVCFYLNAVYKKVFHLPTSSS